MLLLYSSIRTHAEKHEAAEDTKGRGDKEVDRGRHVPCVMPPVFCGRYVSGDPVGLVYIGPSPPSDQTDLTATSV